MMGAQVLNLGSGTWHPYKVDGFAWRTACREIRGKAGRVITMDAKHEREELPAILGHLGIESEGALEIVVCLVDGHDDYMVWVKEGV